MPSESDRQLLLRIARQAMAAHLGGEPPSRSDEGQLASRRGGAFVTIRKAGDLRGCIGHIEPGDRLLGVVSPSAVAACSPDPPFPPLASVPLPQVAIQHS